MDNNGTFFSAVLTVLTVMLLFVVAVLALPFIIAGVALYLAACVVWMLAHPERKAEHSKPSP